MKLLARLLLVSLGVSVFAPAARPFIERAWFVYTLAIEEPADALPSPLAARRAPRFVDSWGNARSGGRRHEGIDIFAPKDTPVLSTTRGIVTRVGANRLGGQIIWILGPGLERHYYAHLNRYGVFREGDRVEAGEIFPLPVELMRMLRDGERRAKARQAGQLARAAHDRRAAHENRRSDP